MARTSTVTTQTTIASAWANALITDYVSQTDTTDQDLASDLEIVTGKELRANTISETSADTGVTIDGIKLKDSIVYTDTVAEKTGAAGVTIDSVVLKDGEINFAAGKRPKADLVYLNPAAAPAATEGHLYYDSTADKLIYRDSAAWRTIPAATGGGGAASHGAYTYIIYLDGANYYAEDFEGNLIYGGSGDLGVDGTYFEDVFNACSIAGSSGCKIVIAIEGTIVCYKSVEIADDGQNIEGLGWSTILKVCNQETELLTGNAAAAQKDVAVVDGSVFKVGQHVAVIDDNFDEHNEIASIAGNTLTMVFNLDNTYATADNAFVATTFTLMQTAGAEIGITQYYNITLRDFALDANSANNTHYSVSGEPYYQNLLTIRDIDKFTMDNISFIDALRVGAELMGLYHNITNCICDGCDWNGIQVSADYSNVANCISINSGGGPDPVAFCDLGANFVNWSNCIAFDPDVEHSAFNVEYAGHEVTFNACQAVGGATFFEMGFSIVAVSYNVKIVNCTMYLCLWGVNCGTTEYNIQVLDSNFIDCFDDSEVWHAAIYLRGEGCVVSGNYFDNTNAGASGKGIRLADNASYSRITDNTIRNMYADWSIYIEDAVAHVIITSNICYDDKGSNTAKGIAGAGTTDYLLIKDNDVSGTDAANRIAHVGVNDIIKDNIGNVGAYQTAAAFAAPSGVPAPGTICVFGETTGGTVRLYVYDAAGWHYISQSG